MPAVEKVIDAQLANLETGSVLKGSELTPLKGYMLCTEGFADTIANLSIKATYIAAIRNKTLFPLFNLDSYEVTGDDKTYTSQVMGDLVTEKAMLKYAFKHNLPFDVHQKLQSFDRADLRLIRVRKGKIEFYNDGGTGRGFSLLNINVGGFQEVPGDGANPALSMVTVTMAAPEEWDKYGKYVNPSWNVLSVLKPMLDVQIAITIPFTLTGGQVTVKAPTGLYDAAGAPTYTMIRGIPLADFDNGANTISSYTDNGDGTYDLVGTGWITGSINLKDPADMVGTELLIESISADVSYTI